MDCSGKDVVTALTRCHGPAPFCDPHQGTRSRRTRSRRQDVHVAFARCQGPEQVARPHVPRLPAAHGPTPNFML